MIPLPPQVLAFFAKPIIRKIASYALGALALGLLILALRGCGSDDKAEQVKQTTRSAEAISQSAGDAISTYGNTMANEAAGDHDTGSSNQEIANAQTRDAQRRIVLERVCASKGHRNDPACKLLRDAAP